MESGDKRQAILDAAASRFSTSGFHETKVEQIAEDAGVAKGTVYLYFKDKNTLLFEVGRYLLESHQERVRETIAPHDTAAGKLRAYARHQMEQFPEVVNFNKLNFEHLLKARSEEGKAEMMRKGHRVMLEILTGVIEHGMARGEFRAMNATDAALIVSGALNACVHGKMLGVIDAETGDRAEEIVNLMIGGFAADDE